MLVRRASIFITLAPTIRIKTLAVMYGRYNATLHQSS